MNEDCARSKQHLATEDFCSSVGTNPSIVELHFYLWFYGILGDLASLTKTIDQHTVVKTVVDHVENGSRFW